VLDQMHPLVVEASRKSPRHPDRPILRTNRSAPASEAITPPSKDATTSQPSMDGGLEGKSAVSIAFFLRPPTTWFRSHREHSNLHNNSIGNVSRRSCRRACGHVVRPRSRCINGVSSAP
jgi:hypothetical protein